MYIMIIIILSTRHNYTLGIVTSIWHTRCHLSLIETGAEDTVTIFILQIRKQTYISESHFPKLPNVVNSLPKISGPNA